LASTLGVLYKTALGWLIVALCLRKTQGSSCSNGWNRSAAHSRAGLPGL
jgi:hypothetical protein